MKQFVQEHPISSIIVVIAFWHLAVYQNGADFVAALGVAIIIWILENLHG